MTDRVDDIDRASEGAVEVVLGFLPVPWGPIASVAASKFFDRRRDRVVEVGQSACQMTDLETLVDAFDSSERFQDLAYRASEVAWRSHLREKRIMLGRAVGRAASDRAAVDESEFMVHALRDLDAPHLQVLARMVSVEESILETNETDHEEAALAASRVFTGAHASVRSALLGHGCVSERYVTVIDGIDGGNAMGVAPGSRDESVRTDVRYSVSTFGHRLLDEVRAAEREASGEVSTEASTHRSPQAPMNPDESGTRRAQTGE